MPHYSKVTTSNIIDLLILLENQSVVMIGHFICEAISLPVDVYVKIHRENAKSTCHTATDKVGGH